MDGRIREAAGAPEDLPAAIQTGRSVRPKMNVEALAFHDRSGAGMAVLVVNTNGRILGENFHVPNGLAACSIQAQDPQGKFAVILSHFGSREVNISSIANGRGPTFPWDGSFPGNVL